MSQQGTPATSQERGPQPRSRGGEAGSKQNTCSHVQTTRQRPQVLAPPCYQSTLLLSPIQITAMGQMGRQTARYQIPTMGQMGRQTAGSQSPRHHATPRQGNSSSGCNLLWGMLRRPQPMGHLCQAWRRCNWVCAILKQLMMLMVPPPQRQRASGRC